MKKFSRLCSLAVAPLLIAGGLTAGAQAAQAAPIGYGYLDMLVIWNDRTTVYNDINLSVAQSKDYSGQYYWAEYNSGGTWRASTTPKKYITNGTYANWFIMATNMAVGTAERMRGDHGAYAGTYT